jgi:predicted dinucleotide-binding enzyme
MKIGILGTGNIGRTLGQKWDAAGHEVFFGTRDPGSGKVRDLLSSLGGAAAGTATEAIAFGRVVLFAIPWSATEGVVKANAAALAGKIVIDATNNFDGRSPVNNLAAFQDNAPDATYYRAFNSLGWEVFAQPVIGGFQIDHFYCGPEGERKEVVTGLVADVGLNPLYLGDLNEIDLADALGSLWVGLVFRRGMPRRMALKLLTAG